VLRWRYADRDDQGFLDQLFEVRLTVEPAVARLAAVRRDDADLVRLRAALSAMGASRDSAGHVEADVTFHRALLVSAHNELFEQMAIVVEVGLRARDQLVHSRISKSSVPEHAAVIDAVEARDAGAAEHAMRRLLLDTNPDVDAARGVGPGIDQV
jgi:GntR family galactonate operon transcriptional repressor